MAEEKRDNSIYVLGILIALALIFYGLWTEKHPVAVEIVELVTNKTVELLDPKIITRVNKEIVHLTATPGTSVNDVIYATPAIAVGPVDEAATVIAQVEATLRELTPIAPSPTPEATPTPKATMYLPPAPSTLAPMPPTPTQVPVPPTATPAPTQVPVQPTVPPAPTQVPAGDTVPPAPTQVPVPPTAPPAPTQVPVPPTVPPAPPTWTQVPPTPAPPTWTQVPPTPVPPTPVPPTQVPPTQVPTVPPVPTFAPTASPELVAPDLLNGQDGNTELAPAGGSATLQGNITGSESGQLTMILTNGDYYQAMVVGSGGNFSFPNVPNGTYNLSVNQGGPGAGCAEITVSVPEGHATLTYNYRYYKRQCTSN